MIVLYTLVNWYFAIKETISEIKGYQEIKGMY